jgi:putative ABC transport system substrate-binding protein
VNPRDTNETFIEPFRRDMASLGWIEHENVEYQFAWAGGRNAALEPLSADMVARKVDVLLTFGPDGTRAAQRATSTIPIVAMTDDLVAGGFVKSMAKPGGNTTGVAILAHELDLKRLEVLHETVPAARRIGVLYDPGLSRSVAPLKTGAASLGIEVVFAAAQGEAPIAAALKTLIGEKVGAVNVLASANLNAFRALQIKEFTRARLPSMYEWPETAEQGGLLGYGPRNTAVYRQVAELVNKILRGARPADLPVEQPTKFEFIINMKTAKAIGLSIPQSMLLRADKVIQ